MKRSTRREFNKKAGGAFLGAIGFPYIVPSSALGADGTVAPSDRIVMGCVGVGNMGGGHVGRFLAFDDVQMTAVCDVYDENNKKAKAKVDLKYGNSDCAVYKDYRELLARDDIDAIMTATPDSWHVLVGIEAAAQGKHMYYEKPLAMSITEAKAIRAAVKKSGVVFQFGTQQRSDERFRLACELVLNGKIGELKTINIGSADYAQIPAQPTEAVPPGFDYDMWLGPAPVAPYTTARKDRWTLLRDYSLGCIGGAWGVHHVDIAQWANASDHTDPVEISGTGSAPEGFFDTAMRFNIEHTYENGVKLIHMDRDTARKSREQYSLHWEGVLFEGTEGWIFVCRKLLEAEPKSILNSVLSSSDIRLEKSFNHQRNFLDAVKSGDTTISPIDTAFRSDIICHQADIAIALGRKLTWDPVREEFPGDDEANALMTRPMRAPWQI
jgi:predicted dehydrogenase